MKRVDLHVHSTISDGTDTPSELVALAVHTGLSAFALTDHDTTSGIDEALTAAENTSLQVISGVELSTNFEKSKIHIVGLFIGHHNTTLTHFLDAQRQSRINRNIKMCSRFSDIGIALSYEQMTALYPDAVITRAHFADYLAKNGYVRDRNEAFARYLNPDKPCYVKRAQVDPKDAIEIIHKAGGISILAHPLLYHLDDDRLNRLLDYLCPAGIDGIEALYSTHSADDERYIKKLADERKLLISGGSDYHGKNKPGISLGTGMGDLLVPESVLDGLWKRHLSVSSHIIKQTDTTCCNCQPDQLHN